MSHRKKVYMHKFRRKHSRRLTRRIGRMVRHGRVKRW
jgi:hypothetical protein